MLHMSSMTNGYVRRDMNRESNFFSNAEGQEHLLMADGTAMTATAFRDAHPTTKYTPEELGMDVSASPFYDAGSETYSGAVAIESDAQTSVPSVFSGQSSPTFAASSALISDFNNWASQNVGIIMVGLGVIYGIYRFGYQRGHSNAA